LSSSARVALSRIELVHVAAPRSPLKRAWFFTHRGSHIDLAEVRRIGHEADREDSFHAIS
jgi:hypothetical protein